MKIISLYAGPGAGKSTNAADLFATAKRAGINTELVREYVKDWAWEKRKIGVFDQLYFLGKQVRRESMLFDCVNLIVTDSPIWLCAYYAERYGTPALRNGVEAAVRAFYDQARIEGHEHLHVWVHRAKAYVPTGRYETEEQALEVDVELRAFLEDRGIPLRELVAPFVHGVGIDHWLRTTLEEKR